MSRSHEITSEQLAACKKQLERRWTSRKVDETLLKFAWQAAYEVASLLYDEFCVTKVAVFGSLAEPIGFKESSDIDIAVWGLSDKELTRANDKVRDIISEFKVDLICFESAKGLFRDRIIQNAIPIYRSELAVMSKTAYEHLQHQVFLIVEEDIYEINRKKLTQRINDELHKINELLLRIHRGIERLKVVSADVTEFIENTIANDLADIYMGVERIFLRIANEIDAHLPQGSKWHKELLVQMTEQRPERLPVISENIYLQLAELLNFRHKVRNIYGTELKFDNTLTHAEAIGELIAELAQALKIFTNSLT